MKCLRPNFTYDYEIIFVDDGSVDDTYKILRRAQAQVQNLAIIRFKKNFGQTPAFSAGFSYATGDYIISMDGDLQNDPQDTPKLLKAIERKYDAICGWRKQRHDSASKRFLSKVFSIVRYLLLGDPVHDASCSFKIFRSAAIKSLLPLRSRNHNCLTSMLHLGGYKVGEIVVSHRPRIHGKTKVPKPFSGFPCFLDATLPPILVVLHPPICLKSCNREIPLSTVGERSLSRYARGVGIRKSLLQEN